MCMNCYSYVVLYAPDGGCVCICRPQCKVLSPRYQHLKQNYIWTDGRTEGRTDRKSNRCPYIVAKCTLKICIPLTWHKFPKLTEHGAWFFTFLQLNTRYLVRFTENIDHAYATCMFLFLISGKIRKVLTVLRY